MKHLKSAETNYSCFFVLHIPINIPIWSSYTEGHQIDINWNNFTKNSSYNFGDHKNINNDITIGTNEEPVGF